MGAETKISWATDTWNPIRGCTKYSAGCSNCYAATLALRNPKTLGVWGPNGDRVHGSHSYWNQPLKWDKDALSSGTRRKVFCASLADIFEQWDGPIKNTKGLYLGTWNGSYPYTQSGVVTKPQNGHRMVTMDDIRLRVFDLIRRTPNLDWLLLTKRIEHVLSTLRRCADLCEGQKSSDVWDTLKWIVAWLNGNPPKNVWLGTSVENKETAWRLFELAAIPAVVHWVSLEPLLGPVNLRDIKLNENDYYQGPDVSYDALKGEWDKDLAPLDWAIVGGESGSKARPFDLQWARDIRDQCKESRTTYFLKQVGANVYDSSARISIDCLNSHALQINFRDRSGSDPSEWPKDLRDCQAFPKVVE